MKRIMFTATLLMAVLGVCAAPNKNEVRKLRDFLQTESVHNKANYVQLGVSINDPASWNGVTWSNDGHVTAIDWHDKKLCGQLDVSGFAALQSMDISRNEITMVNVSGCTALQSLDVSRNHLSQLVLDNCPRLVAINCYRNRLTDMSVEGTPMLKCSIVRATYL